MKLRILNLQEVPVDRRGHGDDFACDVAWAGHAIGSRQLGFNITVVPPGKRPFPYHAHHGNEEMFFVLEGEGSIRIAGKSHKIRKGDFISVPAGADSAHQIVNDSEAPLRYLAVSTMMVPDVVEYPDTGKLGLFTGAAPGHKAPEGAIRDFFQVKKVDYWDGE